MGKSIYAISKFLLKDKIANELGTIEFRGVPGLFLGRAGPALRAGADNYVRARARSRAGAGP